jgi:hypothetical protein
MLTAFRLTRVETTFITRHDSYWPFAAVRFCGEFSNPRAKQSTHLTDLAKEFRAESLCHQQNARLYFCFD